MAIKKRRKKRVVDVGPKPGRKKELKRFEMVIWDAAAQGRYENGAPINKVAPNEVAFVIRTSGGTPLNQTDVNKAYRTLQHFLRSLGHKLKRKGQELDPAPKEEPKPQEAATPPDVVQEGEKFIPEAQDEDHSAHDHSAPDPDSTLYASPTNVGSLADPDDSDPTH